MSRWLANLATLANGLCGVGAIAYILAGNKTWAGLLIVAGVGFDGLDGILSRRSGAPSNAFGRTADSVSDAITFGAAPAAMLMVHMDHAELWSPYAGLAIFAGILLAVLALARLVYFTLRGFHHKDFVGVPTPQTALAVVALALWLEVPAFAGVQPLALLALAILASALMVAPISFPKIRKGAKLRVPMTVTAVAFVLAEIPVQFRPPTGTPLYDLALGATVLATGGLLLYYVAGPWTVPPKTAPEGAPTDG
jgi:phosphatidylserine synthase